MENKTPLTKYQKLNTIISLETAKELKARGCDVEYTRTITKEGTAYFKEKVSVSVEKWGTPTYDLSEIITNGEMAKAFL